MTIEMKADVAVLSFPLGTGSTAQKSTTGGHTAPVKHTLEQGTTLEVRYALWGSGNVRPQDIIKAMNLNGIAKAGLRIRSKAHFGAGPRYYRRTLDGLVPLPMDAPDAAPVRDFHQRNRLPHYLKEVVMNHEWWGQTVHECVVSKDLRTILSVRPLKTAWCRWSLQDEKSGRIEWCVFNPNWETHHSNHIRLIPVADPWWTTEELRNWLRSTGYRKFVWAATIPDPDVAYYPDCDWHALYDNGWLKHNNEIPANKLATLMNQMSLKYLFKIPNKYWEDKYPETWSSMNAAQKEEKKKETFQLINKFLTGGENAGKALFTPYATDDMGNMIHEWKLEPVDDRLKDGAYIPDSEKGNSEILATMAVDPTLLGQGAPGGKLGAGSGSDKREAIIILDTLLQYDREQTCEAWHRISAFNGWPQDIVLTCGKMELPVMETKPAPAPPPPAPTPQPEA